MPWPKGKPRGSPIPGAIPFPKGVSPNPGGRPKIVRELLDLARASVPDAFAFARKVLLDEKEQTRNRLECAKFLVAYGLGAPKKQEDDGGDEDDLPAGLTLDECRALARRPLSHELPPDDEPPN